jgi:membrane peptidoglycan carboxypeptidase
MTHGSQSGGYDYYADDEPDGYDEYDDRGYTGAHPAGGFDRDDPDPDDEKAAAKAKRRTIYRRIRRSSYVAAAVVFVGLTAFGIYGYMFWPLEKPQEVAAKTKQVIKVDYSNGQEMTKIDPQQGMPVTMVNDLHKEISQPMLDASMAAEDSSFYSNWGFDPMGILRAALTGSGGGSTMTQQYIKLQTGHDQHTYTRKFHEMILALKLTNTTDKDEIFKAYVNTAYYGRGARGINSAAEAYFGKKPKDLTPAESAVLAGMVQSPAANDPKVNPAHAKQRFEYVAGQMKEHFPGKGYDNVQAQGPPQTLPRRQWRGTGVTPSQYHIRQQILDELQKQGYDQGRLAEGGFEITTTIDPKAQQAAEQAVHDVTNGQPPDIHASFVATDPKTGGVKAYYGGDQIGGIDYAATPMSPGSSFKPFVTVTGLKQGVGVGERYDGRDNQNIAGTVFHNSDGVNCLDAPQDQCDVRDATTESVNTVFVNMANKFGPKNVAQTATEAGIPATTKNSPTLQSPNGRTELGVALGMYPVKPIDLTTAYNTLANEGTRTRTHFVKSIKSSDDQTKSFDNSDPAPAWGADSKAFALNVIDTMLDVADHSHDAIGRPVASKTGTQQLTNTGQNQTATMAGFTPQVTAVSTMLAGDGNQPLKEASGKKVYGAGLPGHVWKEFMTNYLAGQPPMPYPQPDKKIGNFDNIPIWTPPPPPPPEDGFFGGGDPNQQSQEPTQPGESSSSQAPTSSSSGGGMWGGGSSNGGSCGLFNPCDGGNGAGDQSRTRQDNGGF